MLFGNDSLQGELFSANFDLSNLTAADGLEDGLLLGSNAGDVNGNGFNDILIGADGADPNGNDSFEDYVIFGELDLFA